MVYASASSATGRSVFAIGCRPRCTPSAKATTAAVSEGKQIDLALPDDLVSEPITGISFSNELIDAFPVHRVISRNGTLKELCVGLSDADDFVWTESDVSSRAAEYCERIQLQLAE